jgi:hypothetical protein
MPGVAGQGVGNADMALLDRRIEAGPETRRKDLDRGGAPGPAGGGMDPWQQSVENRLADIAAQLRELREDLRNTDRILGAKIDEVDRAVSAGTNEVERTLGARIDEVERTLGARMDTNFRRLLGTMITALSPSWLRWRVDFSIFWMQSPAPRRDPPEGPRPARRPDPRGRGCGGPG